MVASLVERLPAEAIRTTVVTLDAPGPVAARLRGAGVPVHALGPVDGLAPTARRLAGVLRRERPDVVNAYGLRGTMLVRLLARAQRPRPAVVSGVRGLHVTD